jgi:TonB family protein
MNAIIITIALVSAICGLPQDPTLEARAVTRVQQTLASQYDPALPGRGFGTWFNQLVGPQAGVTWHLTECVERAGVTPGGEQETPACVEATAILPDERKVVAQIFVGSLRQGLTAKAKFHFAVIEEEDQFRNAATLSDLPLILKTALPKIRLKTVELPRIRAARTPQLSMARAPVFLEFPKTPSNAGGLDAPPPPPKKEASYRISKGVTPGDAITRVTPVYPSMARQINASGEVRVEISIDEAGHVAEAKAVSGHPMLRLAAEEAARKWVFKQTLLDGKPVKQQTVLTFIFTPPPQ